jgi:hypothetical protein
MNVIYYFSAALAIGLVLAGLLWYYRVENQEIKYGKIAKRPLLGKLFIPILILCSVLGMAITEWQGVCRLSPFGFIVGVFLGTVAEIIAWYGYTGKISP